MGKTIKIFHDCMVWIEKSVTRVTTGIIPFSRLGVFYANLGSAEIFLPTENGVLKTNGKLIYVNTSVPNVGIVDILNGFSVSTCK